MTVTKLQRKLTRILRDLDEIAGELIDRRFERDWLLVERALDSVGEVCSGFLDEDAIQNLHFWNSDWGRPEPGLIGIERRCPDLFPGEIPRKGGKVATLEAVKRKRVA